MKQSKLRRRRVIRFAILYYVLLVLFVALVVGPAVGGDKIDVSSIADSINGLGFKLMQPNNQNHDDTRGKTETGTGDPNYSGILTRSTEEGGRATDRIRLF